MTAREEFGRVAVIYGGLGAERDVSLNSGSRVLAALRTAGVDAHGVDAGHDLIARLQHGAFERAFVVLHGTGGEDGRLQGTLEWLDLPYTGAGVLGSALSMDKLRCKQIWRSLGIRTPPFTVLRNDDDCHRAVDDLGLPLIVKPSREGSSVGMAKVSGADQLGDAFRDARRYDAVVFAEQWIHGAEYTVAVLDGAALPAIRLETPREFYDYAAKYTVDSTQYHIPCGLDAESEASLGELAVRAFDAIDAHGWGRVDFMADSAGAPFVLEVNTVPGMTDHSLVPMAARAAGIDFPSLCVRVLRTSFVDRSAAAGPVHFMEDAP
ncbi:MAG: D-alanine--D-alanine ligase [Gammaproteobacteria bacterium]